MPPPRRGKGKGKGKFGKDKKDKGQRALFRRRKFCRFTAEKVEWIDYKDVDVLKDFVNETGKIIPAGKAKRATPENIKHFEGRRAELEKAQNETLAKAQERGTKLEGQKISITQKAGVDGRLFGSVTNYDIVEALEKQGHEVERSQVRMPQGPLKQVGEFPIQIALHTDVTGTIPVAVIGEP